MNKKNPLILIIPIIAILIAIATWHFKSTNQAAQTETQPDTNTLGIAKPEIPKDMILWFNADRVESVNHSEVAIWPDDSGHDHHALQENPDRQPKLINNAINGKPCVSFDGINDGLNVNGSEESKPEELHLFIVCRSESIHRVIIGYPYHSNHKNPYYSWAFFHSATPKDGVNLRIGRNDFNTKKSNSWKRHSIYSYTTNPRKLHINGTLFQEEKGIPIKYSNSSGLKIAYNADQQENFQGEIPEIILYDHQLTDEDRQRVELYLSDKYSIQLVTD